MQLGIYKANVWNVATLGNSILPQSNTEPAQMISRCQRWHPKRIQLYPITNIQVQVSIKPVCDRCTYLTASADEQLACRKQNSFQSSSCNYGTKSNYCRLPSCIHHIPFSSTLSFILQLNITFVFPVFLFKPTVCAPLYIAMSAFTIHQPFLHCCLPYSPSSDLSRYSIKCFLKSKKAKYSRISLASVLR